MLWSSSFKHTEGMGLLTLMAVSSLSSDQDKIHAVSAENTLLQM